MDIANYKTAVNRAGQVGHYPLSTETLDFIQEQIKLLQKLSGMSGYQHPWVVRSPDASHEGILLYKDELLPIEPISSSLTEGATYDLCLRERKQEVQTLEDTYSDARLYRTAYIAAKGTADTIGSVVAASTTSVYTPGAYTLAQLATSVTSVACNLHNNELGKAMLTASNIDSSWLGRKRLYATPDQWKCDSLASYELDGAHLTTRFVNNSHKSFTQELETKDGVRYRRTYIDDEEFVTADFYPESTIDAWFCLPNQVLGACCIRFTPDSGSIKVNWRNGVLQSAHIGRAGDDQIFITPNVKSGMLDSEHSRLDCVCSPIIVSDFTPTVVRATYGGANGAITILFDMRMRKAVDIILSVVSI